MKHSTGHFEGFKDAAGNWRWRLRSANGRIVAVSAEGFACKRNAGRAITTMMDTAKDAVGSRETIRWTDN